MTLLSNTDFFPTIFKTLDANAIKARRLFFRLLILDVILLILIPASILSTSFYISSITFRVIPILPIFIVFCINIVWPTPTLVKNWQTLRSAAESVKKEYMIYSVACPPYQIKNDQYSKEKLISNIDKILEEVKEKPANLSPKESNNLYFTELGRKLRSSEFDLRVKYYLKNRLEDQINWYSTKSNRNSSSDSHYKVLMFLFLIVSALVAFYTSVFQYSLVGAVDIMVAIILGLQTYGNASRFSELAITYNNILFELESCKASMQVESEEKFCEFVLKIENAISREHSVWSFKRGKI